MVMVASLGGYSYMGFAPCSSCHQDEPFLAATAASAHSEVDCVVCHAPPGYAGRIDFGVRHLFNALRFVGNPRDLAKVDDTTCLTCHQDVMDIVAEVEGVRINHAYCATEADCTDCHASVTHGREISWVRTYDMETCLACHVAEGPVKCETCHTGRLAEDRITTGVFAITHGPNWEETHGMGDPATCAACHTAASCQTCHGVGVPHETQFMRVHSDFAQQGDAQCGDCHEERFCDDCHGLAMPHPNAFVRAHAKSAGEDRELCRRCHLEPDCLVCHETHVHPGGAIGMEGGR